MQNINQYRDHLQYYFDRLIELRHTVYHVNNLLNQSIKRYREKIKDNQLISGSHLVISDITGPTDNGWTINFHSGASKIIMADAYEEEINRIISTECCYAFAQGFEALEKLLKDLLHEKAQIDRVLQDKIKLKWKTVDRKKYKGGDDLFKMIKKVCEEDFIQFSNNNNFGLRFKEFWSVISNVRHAIIHKQSVVTRGDIYKSKTYIRIFEYFFSHTDLDGNMAIALDYRKCDKLMKTLAEFGFQIYKMMCIQSDLEWKIEKVG